ncbi:probable transcription factor PosF21 [Durio zibethinus]|uniref:Probable transcription factor PosF21 n=1 Tax=Durio zibethinus TaxID=66656 RepID=A0A6P5X4D8_DURZI|nr:probable transcription factor PosF21 [Durio zibethinus]
MEKDKSPGLPPLSGRFSGFSSAGNAPNTFSVRPETCSFGQTTEPNGFSHDISKMPDNPPKNLSHRRAQSEIVTLSEDINFNSDLGVVGEADGPMDSDETEDDLLTMYLYMDKFNSSSANSTFQVGESSTPAGLASAPVAAVGVGAGAGAGTGMLAGENMSIGVGSSDKPRVKHQQSQSMNGLTSINPAMFMSCPEELSPADSKKAMSAAKLAELALIDPKRAKRIWANRQSAARSKERKVRYIAELERKVQTLQAEATSLSAQLSLLQRDTNGLTVENSELKLRLQTTEQQIHLQDALNGALKEEIQHLKVLTGQSVPNGGPMVNFAPFGASQQYYPNNYAMHALLTAQQFQQLQIHLQKQQYQFPPHQLHQLQQQQEQQQQQQQTGEMRVRGSMPSPNQKDCSSEVSSTASKD